MIYREFKELNLPLLGFGAMRLPVTESGEIDVGLTEKMVDYAMARGVNYFDTAYPYHAGQSETVIGRILSKYPRESYFLADKYPGHQLRERHDPREVFENQLKKCGVEYFDFYLLHDVNEKSVETYTDERWGIIPYFLEQKRLGRIKHLGFSSHAMAEGLESFLERYGRDMEFCQIQMNYLDYTLQDAKRKYELLTERGIGVWIMEPVRGGKLAVLPEWASERLGEHRRGASAASFAFRWLMQFDNIKMILSGMSNMDHVTDNVITFEREEPLSAAECEILSEVAESYKRSVPCTACRYCTDGCPSGLDIPMLISTYNELQVSVAINVARRVEFLPDDKKPSACIGCGKCTYICPQKIDIPTVMYDLAAISDKAPKWTDICRQRELEEKQNRG